MLDRTNYHRVIENLIAKLPTTSPVKVYLPGAIDLLLDEDAFKDNFSKVKKPLIVFAEYFSTTAYVYVYSRATKTLRLIDPCNGIEDSSSI